MNLATYIRTAPVAGGEIGLYYLAQAGFCLKSGSGTVVHIDPYLSDYCQKAFGFRRMIPSLLTSRQLTPHVLAFTHAHGDHLDPDALSVFATRQRPRFIGPADCVEEWRKAGIPAKRCRVLACGDSERIRDIRFKATYADHGDLAPDAIGFLVSVDGIVIYNAGDTAYTPDKILPSLGDTPVDIMIAPINGAYGNLDHVLACRLAALLRPKVVIASHFGMFIEHGGDPGAFLAEAKSLPAGMTALVMAPGEEMVYSRSEGIRRRTSHSAEGGGRLAL